MRCRNCGAGRPVGYVLHLCRLLFQACKSVYDYAVVGTSLTRDTIASRAPGIWRYAELLRSMHRRRAVFLSGQPHSIVADRLARVLGLDGLLIGRTKTRATRR